MKEATIHSAPDFSTWKLIQRFSMLWNANAQKVEAVPYAKENKNKPEWTGTTLNYEFGEHLARGQEFDFFEKQVLLKRWGLGGENEYHDFSIFANGKWQTFTSDIHEPIVSALTSTGDAKKRVIAIRLEATTKKAGGQLLSPVEVRRD